MGMNKGRVLVLDTETTGFLANGDDRIIEVGIVELIGREITGNVMHVYIDPERDVPEEAYAVHGLSRDDLVNQYKAKPFEKSADQLLDFIGDDTIVAHNAPFDISFLDAELKRCRRETFTQRGNIIIDSLKVAGMKYPGQANNLDALCRRLLGSNNYERDLHGALLDASLLARVYLLMTVEQNNLQLEDRIQLSGPALNPERLILEPGRLRVAKASQDDKDRHAKVCERIVKSSNGKHCNALSLSF